MMIKQPPSHGSDAERPPRSGWLCSTMIALALFLLANGGAAARGEVTVGEAVRAVHEAAAALESGVGELPRQARLEIGTDVHFLARSADKVLERLTRQPLAAASAEVEEDLLFLRDLMVAQRGELERLAGRDDRRAEAEVRQLIGVAEERLAAVDQALDRQAEVLEGSVVSGEQASEGLLLHTIDRTLYDGVRLVGAGLFLIGLLLVGLRLLSLSETELSLVELVRQTPVVAGGGMLAVALFLIASVSIIVDPGTVAALGQRTELRPAPGACERLAAQREQLLEARTIGHDGLSDAIKDRMRPVAQDCLKLESQVAAVEAVEWLASSLDPMAEARPGRTARRAAPGTAGAEIERLMSGVDPLTGDDRADRPAGAELAAGGPVEPLPATEDESGPGRMVETTTRVNYRSGPSTAARRLGTLPQGAEVVLLGEDGEWSNIQLADGSSVYVASAYLRSRR